VSGERHEARIRVAGPGDVEAFCDLRIALFEGFAPEDRGDLDLLRRETRAAFLELLASGDARVWLAEDRDGRALGTAALLVVRRFPSPQNPTRREGYLAHMYVRAEARRRGVGSALLRAALDATRDEGLVRLRLHATDDGRALYERFGFQAKTNGMEFRVERAGSA
jgi:GNAT superfamily N-acetyltransferase